MVRDQEVGGSNPLAPTKFPFTFQIDTAVGDIDLQRPFCCCAQFCAHPGPLTTRTVSCPPLRARAWRRTARCGSARWRPSRSALADGHSAGSWRNRCARPGSPTCTVHVRRPSRQAGVPEGVQRELRDVRQGARLGMLLLERGLLDVAAPGRGRKHPLAFDQRPPRFQDGHRPLSHWDRPPGIFGFAERDVDSAVLDVFPSQPEALLGPQAAIDQDGRHVAKQAPVAGFDRLPAALGGADTRRCPGSFPFEPDAPIAPYVIPRSGLPPTGQGPRLIAPSC